MGGFSHSVGLDDRGAKHPFKVCRHSEGKGGRARPDEAQGAAGDRGSMRVRLRQDGVVDCGNRGVPGRA